MKSFLHKQSLSKHQQPSSHTKTQVERYSFLAQTHSMTPLLVCKHENISEHTTEQILPITHRDKVEHISLHDGRQQRILLSTGMIRQQTIAMKTMTAAPCNYLEHQQEPIYQDIPLGRPIIPPVKKHATGTPY